MSFVSSCHCVRGSWMCAVGYCSRPATCPCLSGSCSNATVQRVCLSLRYCEMSAYDPDYWPASHRGDRRPCEICGGKSVTESDFSLRTYLDFPLSVLFDKCSIRIYHSLSEDEKATDGSSQIKKRSFSYRKPWTLKYFGVFLRSVHHC